ncbi:MAG: thrombospondin type 3 repeat-containing protein [Phycisphaerae bacterium]|nr:thrombospondin type 3 repeat-containing protein [Phycisphaerae bacterium]
MCKSKTLLRSLLVASYLVAGAYTALADDDAYVKRTDGGNLNGQPIDYEHYELSVLPGAAIVGTVVVETYNTMPSTSVAPLGWTVDWGTRENQPRLTNGWIASGTHVYTADIDINAPTTPGEYHLILAFGGEFNIGQVMSATNWPCGDGLWYDGNDLGFDWAEPNFETALLDGRAYFAQLKCPDGVDPFYDPAWRPATTVVLHVSGDCNNNGIPDTQDIADCDGSPWCDDCNDNGLPDECDISTQGELFCNASSWATFDYGEHCGTDCNDPDGYSGAAFDGRYIYFAPYHNGDGCHGEVLRHDTQGDFGNASAWATFDPGDHGVGTDPDGYTGVVFDGRYLYFAPSDSGGDNMHGEVLRYDTQGGFDDPLSWATYDYGEHCGGECDDPDGFSGVVFDGQYVYFVPYLHGNYQYGGEVMRYNTAGAFDDTASWDTFDPWGNGLTDAGGYQDAIFDGRYIYFSPYRQHHSIQYQGAVLRYDTNADFTNVSSWITFDPGAEFFDSQGYDPDGYSGGVFDGRYVYFAPFTHELSGSRRHGEVLRHDTTGDFADISSWSIHDASNVGDDSTGYTDALFDGQFVYFVPRENNSERHGQVLRYDTSVAFGDASAWSICDPGALGVGNDPVGYARGVSDGQFLYFAPCENGVENNGEHHGEVLRYDTGLPVSPDCNDNDIPDECELQGNDCNTNGIPDDCEEDSDGDGIIDDCDNCPDHENSDQADFDGDLWGDACDDDIDNDGVLNESDVCDYTRVGAEVDDEGRPRGDLDMDCDTDLDDYAIFQRGFTGPDSH